MPALSTCGTLQFQIAQQLNEVSATESPTYLGYINMTTHDIENRWQLGRYLETSADHTVSSSTYQYTFPMTDFASMYSVIDPVNNRKLSFVTKQEFDALSPSASSNLNIPTHYTIWNENILFYPTPNASITYHYSYQKLLSDVSAESAVMPFPNRFLEFYVSRGIQLGLERRGDYQQSKVFEQRYISQVEQMIRQLKATEMKRVKSAREFKPNFTSDPIKNAIWNA